VLLAHTLIGTALVAAGTNAWNQVREREVDALMNRTRAGRSRRGVTPRAAAWFASAITVGASPISRRPSNLLTAGLAALRSSASVSITPLKRTTSLNTLIGAVPGALPIVGGWTAAGEPGRRRRGPVRNLVPLAAAPFPRHPPGCTRDYRAGGLRCSDE